MLAPLTMRLWVILASLSLVCLATADPVDNTAPEDRSSTPTLRILELIKVSRETTPDDQTPRDHNVKIVLDEHALIVGVTLWTLNFLVNGDNVLSSLDAVTETDGLQREFVFKTELPEGITAVLVAAKGKSGNVLATGTVYVQIPANLVGSLAWVGEEYHPSSLSSLRVDPGILSEVWVGNRVCRRERSPCYFLQKELPDVVSRCLTLTDTLTNAPVVLCDETVAPFQELYPTPSLHITDDHLLEVSMSLSQDVALGREVVAYDPRDPSVVFSPEGFLCDPSGVGDRGESECSQRLVMSEAKATDVLSVLVVLEYPGGRLESKLLTYGGQEPRASQTGVIVGSVVGGLLGVILIAAAVFFLLRWRNKKEGKEGSSTSHSSHYTATPTSNPVVA